MPQKCPYCDKEVKARGRKNHIRLMSGDGHGPKGEVPDSLADDVDGYEGGENGPENDADAEEGESPGPGEESDSGPSEASEPAEVTAEDIGDTTPEGVADDADDGDGYPFDPDDDDAIRLEGDETIYVRVDGEVVQATPSAGDWLLITDDGPVLYDDETGDRFEVVTA